MDATLISLLVILAVVVIGFVVTPFLNKKGLLKDINLAVSSNALEIAQIVAKNSNYKDNDKTVAILEVAKTCVRYVEQTAKEKDNELKKGLAQEMIIDTLIQMGISITPDIERLIELGIESAVNALPKTNK